LTDLLNFSHTKFYKQNEISKSADVALFTIHHTLNMRLLYFVITKL